MGWNRTDGTTRHTLDSSSVSLLTVQTGWCHNELGMGNAKRGMVSSGTHTGKEKGVVLLFRLSLLVSAY